MPNSTVTSTSTSTVTFTGTTTINHTVTTQATSFLGLPWWLVAIVAFAFIGIFYAAMQNRAGGIGTIKSELLFAYRNKSAIWLKTKKDLSGIFLPVQNARGKVIETLRQTGIPLDVTDYRGAKAYVVKFNDKDRKKWRQDNKETVKKWLSQKRAEWVVANPDKKEKESPIKESQFEDYPEELKRDARPEFYLDVSRGRFQRVSLAMSVEGTGSTVDFPSIIENTILNNPTPSSGIVHELVNAAKEFFKIKAEAMRGSLQSLILPLLCGMGLMAIIMMLLITFTGGKL